MSITSFILIFPLGLALSGCSGAAGDGCSGAPCTPDASPCHVGAVDCSTAAMACRDTGANAAAGTGCGVNKFCSGSGSCGDCTLGEVCTDGISPCHAGATACDTGAAVCEEAGDLAEGTACSERRHPRLLQGRGLHVLHARRARPAATVAPARAEGACVLTVTGSATITYWPEGGGSTDVGNCFGQQAEVFTPNESGGYTLLAPTSGVCTPTNGTFTIPAEVPAGVYLLHFGGTQAYGNYYVETTQPALDFGRDEAVRPDSNVVADTSTIVTFDSSGLESVDAHERHPRLLVRQRRRRARDREQRVRSRGPSGEGDGRRFDRRLEGAAARQSRQG